MTSYGYKSDRRFRKLQYRVDTN